MDIFALSERAMAMEDTDWERHANPWSVWTRMAVLPFLVLAVWSRAWIGWAAVLPFSLVVAWVWLNPRIFPAPATLDSWASKGVLGERVFLARHAHPIPEHHRRWAIALTLVSALGLPPLVLGVWSYSLPWTLLGLALTMGGKLWFVDRMVWLWEDTGEVPPR